LMILMKQLEIHLMNSLNFTESTVEDFIKDVPAAFRKPTLIDYEFNAFYESYEFGIEYVKKKT
jgi:hypothetical protein